MKAMLLSPLRAFLLVAASMLIYHFLFAVGAHYFTVPIPPIVGHVLLVWVPLIGSLAFFGWATSGSSSSAAWILVQMIVTTVLSMAISLSVMYLFVVRLWGE